MRYTLAVVGFLAAMAASPGCGSKNDAPSSTAPSPTLELAPAVDPGARWVWASTLNLRAADDPSADVLGKLSINDPLTLLDAGDPLSRVRTADGREGWAGTDFLGTELLTLETAQAKVTAAEELGERAEALSWAQRAAALAPDDDAVLRALAGHYERNGRDTEAFEAERALGWPRVIRPMVDTASGWGVDWPYRPEGSPEQPLDLGPLSAEQRAEIGLTPDDHWWVLPSRGAAVRAEVRDVVLIMINECGGDAGVVVLLETTIPDGERPLAATRATPPESWGKALPASPSCGEECAVDRLVEEAERRAGEHAVSDTTVVWDGNRWIAQAAWELPRPPNPDPEDWTYDMDVHRVVLDARVSTSGQVTVQKQARADGPQFDRPLGARDIDGDGKTDRASGNGCSNWISSGREGVGSGETPDRCCGC